MESKHKQETPAEAPSVTIPLMMRNGLPLDDEAYAEIDQPIIPWHVDPVTSADSNSKKNGTPVTTINDGGDGEQLGSQIRDREQFDAASDITSSEPGLGRDNLFSGLGEGFPHESVPPGDLEVTPQNLEKELREALVKSAWGASEKNMLPVKKFLPLNKLDDIITKSSVKAELESWGSLDEEEIALMVHAIWSLYTIRDKGPSSLADNRMSKTTRRRLFAILILAGKPQAILELIKGKIFDIHLPFTQNSETQTLRWQERADNKPQDIAAFADWAERDHDLFNMYQWNLLAPYFSLSSKESPKVHTYRLEGMRPLPFITDPLIASNNDPATGGFAEVRRVKIHEAHLAKGSHGPAHAASGPMAAPAQQEEGEVQSAYFAMKTLIDNSPEAFELEIFALKTIMQGKSNRYVTPLLVAIEHGTDRSLMFPWAEGNLLQFWKAHDNGISQRPADPNMVKWMVKQFAGLASVVTLVHSPTKRSFDEKTETPGCSLQPTQYGRHGDLKPENILFFVGVEHDDDTEPDILDGPRGILKVADFGLAAFHRKGSERQRASRTARSKTHRAPEFDADEVTASADIWSFGCILLEFLVWYQRGMEGVKKFSHDRAEEEREQNPEYVEDKFFIRKAKTHSDFKVKETVVKEIADLRRGSKCSNFCIDVLDLIQCCLLRVKPDERLACGEVHKTLEAIRKTALECNEYCVTPARIESTTLEKSTKCDKRLVEALESNSWCLRRSDDDDALRRLSSEEFSSQAETVYEPSEEMSPQKAGQPQPDAQPDAPPKAQLEEQPAASFGLQYLWGAFLGLLSQAWPFNVVEWRRKTEVV